MLQVWHTEIKLSLAGRRSTVATATFVGLFTVVACGYLASPAAHAAKPAAAAPASSSCDCGAGPWRKYTAVPTPVVQQLFRAATEGDEATFMRLLEIVPNLADYAVDDKPLLAALLEPPRHLRSKRVTPDIPEDEANRIRAAHRALMPAKTRMLKAALEKGASTKDVTYGSRIMPLHLATVYGTPEMVRALLAHGRMWMSRSSTFIKPGNT